MTTPVRPTRAQLAFCFYYGPLIAWIALSLALATSLGSYDNSVAFLYAGLAFLAPETAAPGVDSMYGIVYIARRGVYLVEYGVLTLLIVRALQAGFARIRRRSVIGVAFAAVLFAVLDNTVRSHSAGRHGGWDDITLSLGTVALIFAPIWGFFAIKTWERSRLPLNESAVGKVQ